MKHGAPVTDVALSYNDLRVDRWGRGAVSITRHQHSAHWGAFHAELERYEGPLPEIKAYDPPQETERSP